jgi:hypothetical protein
VDHHKYTAESVKTSVRATTMDGREGDAVSERSGVASGRNTPTYQRVKSPTSASGATAAPATTASTATMANSRFPALHPRPNSHAGSVASKHTVSSRISKFRAQLERKVTGSGRGRIQLTPDNGSVRSFRTTHWTLVSPASSPPNENASKPWSNTSVVSKVKAGSRSASRFLFHPSLAV